MPLGKVISDIFQPNREDEYARIEASGGKVIQWNGHRVFGVLAMSRSIGKFTRMCFRVLFGKCVPFLSLK